MESMKVCNYLRSRLTMTQLHSNIKIKIMVFSEITGPMKVKFYGEPACLRGTNFICEIWVE